jgi:hypothetical protein
VISKLSAYFSSSPIQAIALLAALIAIATTPIAFAVLGRLDWFKARRGRVMMKPEFSSIVVGMMLVMGIPAIFAALVIKSEFFDKDRYEFDPNKSWSVLEQGRGLKDLQAADRKLEDETKRIAEIRKNLVNDVKKLDEAMLVMRAACSQSPATAQALPPVLQRLAAIRREIALDAPQQLMDFTAPPAELPPPPAVAYATAAMPMPGTTALTPPTALAAAAAAGLAKPEADTELAAVPEPQRPLASMLPLVDIPAGWAVSKNGPKHIETFNADNLYEKIDGRAESFTQSNVVGMAYASYHPIGDETNEIQVYIFEFDHSKDYRAQGKYTSEKPDHFDAVKIGTEGYSTAGSLLFYVEPYYTQIVSAIDDPKFAAFSLEIAKRIAAKQAPQHGEAGMAAKGPSLQDTLFALFPAGPGRGAPINVPQDAFGYAFLTDVFMADYKDGSVVWQGFLRPYASVDEAKATFEKYVASAKQNGGDPKLIEAEGADQMFLSASIGLVDVIFRKGNVIGGANGATDSGNNEATAKAKAEAFARGFVKSLPSNLPKGAPAQGAPAEKKHEKPAEAEGEQD